MSRTIVTRCIAVTLLSASLVTQVWALASSGYSIGDDCVTKYGSDQGKFNACCDGGCSATHPGDIDGYRACMDKCKFCWNNRNTCHNYATPAQPL